MYVELLVGNESGTKVYQPVVQEGIEWSTERKNTPGKLVFKVLYDNILDFSEGSPVRMKVDGDNVFFGFVFKQQRTKDKIITVTAYDQLRYLKNKDTKVYEGKTANQFVKMIADDYALNLGTLDDTGYVIESRVEENTSLFEMIANALDLTLTNTGEMYVLYDDFGKLTLKSLSSMYVGVPGAYLMIDEETGQNFDYTSSIDENTYNKIKLTYDNKDTGKRDVYITQDSSNINKWGILQYFDTLQKGENGQAKADALLKLYNKKTRNGIQIVSYRGEENFWGNIWWWIDGINHYANATTGECETYVADHGFTDDSKAAPYEDTGMCAKYGNGYISAFCYSEDFDWLFLPGEFNGNTVLPVGDYCWNQNGTGWRVARLGAGWNDGLGTGAFCWDLNVASSSRDRSIGGRLVYRKR